MSNAEFSGIAGDKALVLFSGGQDFDRLSGLGAGTFRAVETLGFDYGQRHVIELDVRPHIRDAYRRTQPGVAGAARRGSRRRLDALGAISDTALTRDVEIEIADSGLPTTFVPGRNLIFFTLRRRRCLSARRPPSRRRHVRDRLSPAIPIAATTPSRPCRSRSASAWTGRS